MALPASQHRRVDPRAWSHKTHRRVTAGLLTDKPARFISFLTALSNSPTEPITMHLQMLMEVVPAEEAPE